MIKIELNPMEKQRILLYSEQALSDKSHWGDSEVSIPEESNLCELLKNDQTTLTLTRFQFTILFNWFTESTHYGTYLSQEDSSILNKMAAALENHYQTNKINYINNIEDNEFKLRFLEMFIYPERTSRPIPEKYPPKPLQEENKEPSILDKKIRKAVQEKMENDESRSEMIEKIRKNKDEIKDTEKYLKNIIKKTKGKGIF
jgi:hypothetical protein